MEPVTALEACGRLLLLDHLVLRAAEGLLHQHVVASSFGAIAYDGAGIVVGSLLQWLAVRRVVGVRGGGGAGVAGGVHCGGTTLGGLVALEVERRGPHHGVGRSGEDLVLIGVVRTNGLRVIVVHCVALAADDHAVVVHHLPHHLPAFHTFPISCRVFHLIEWHLHVQLSDTAASCNAHAGRPVVLIRDLAGTSDLGLPLGLVESLLILELYRILHVLLASLAQGYRSRISDRMILHGITTSLTDH